MSGNCLLMSAKGVVCVVLALGCALMPPGVRSSSSCHLDEATAIARRTEAIEVQILSKLGITELPQANFSDDHPALETSILRTYHAAVKSVNRRKRRSALDWEDESQDANHDHYYSKTNKVLEIRGEIVHAEHSYVAILADHRRIKAELGGNLSDIYQGELNFAFVPSHSQDKDAATGPHHVRIELLQVVAGPKGTRRMFVDGVDIDLATRDDVVFDVKRVVRQWLAEPCPNNTCRLELHIHSIHREEDSAIERFINGIMPFLPVENGTLQRQLADAYIHTMSHTSAPDSRRLRRRSKRQTLDGEYCRKIRGRNPENCCVKDLELNFRRDLGWDWVREPEKFRPNHCSGACPYRWSSGSAYSSVISMYNNLNPHASAKPCCVADRLGSVILLFTTGSNAKDARVETLNMMTVQTCKCS